MFRIQQQNKDELDKLYNMFNEQIDCCGGTCNEEFFRKVLEIK